MSVVEESWQQRADRLRERADRGHPDAWDRELERELVGVVVDVKEAVPTSYGPVPVVTIRKPDGVEVSVWLMHAVLRRAFQREGVDRGEVVLIRYIGKVERDGGNPYDDYVLVVDREAQTGRVNWGAIAEQHEDPLDEVAGSPIRGRPQASDDLPLTGATTPPADDIPF